MRIDGVSGKGPRRIQRKAVEAVTAPLGLKRKWWEIYQKSPTVLGLSTQ
jgi:hypothetical protein